MSTGRDDGDYNQVKELGRCIHCCGDHRTNRRFTLHMLSSHHGRGKKEHTTLPKEREILPNLQNKNNQAKKLTVLQSEIINILIEV